MKLKIGNTGSWLGFGAIQASNIKNNTYVMNTNTVNGFYMYTCNGYTWEHGKGPQSNGKNYVQGDEFKVTMKGKKLIIEKLIKKKVDKNGSFEILMDSDKNKLGLLFYYTNSFIEVI